MKNLTEILDELENEPARERLEDIGSILINKEERITKDNMIIEVLGINCLDIANGVKKDYNEILDKVAIIRSILNSKKE